MTQQPSPTTETILTLLGLSSIVALVTLGVLHGVWISNLHNGLFALAGGLTGAILLSRRPEQPLARLFVVWGLISAVIYAGRQVGLGAGSAANPWLAWFGVWPVALAIGITTWIIIALPEGTFLSSFWRRLAWASMTMSTALAAVSALWPVEYEENAIKTPFPFDLPGFGLAAGIWPAISIPTYIGLQILWLPALIVRWRKSDPVVRRQLLAVLAVVTVALVALIVGLVAFQTPTPGLLALVPLPPVLGWFIYRHSFAHVVEVERAGGRLSELSPRENDVLDLMARGLSNTAIADRLHVSIKTVEPAISSIFRKLGLDEDPDSNRRVMAVAEYWKRQN